MAIHNDVERGLAPRRLFEDPEHLYEALAAMRQGIRTARGAVRRGDIFTPDAARYFRTLIAEVAWQRGLDLWGEVEDALAWDTEAAVVEVNVPVPWNAGPMMWPSVLWRLPELPPELEYRFVGRDLVLIDVDGNIVVDVLREAVPIYERSESS